MINRLIKKNIILFFLSFFSPNIADYVSVTNAVSLLELAAATFTCTIEAVSLLMYCVFKSGEGSLESTGMDSLADKGSCFNWM